MADGRMGVNWRSLKNWFLCSRPMLALYVLMGRPVMYRMPTISLAKPLYLPGDKSIRVVECEFEPPHMVADDS